MNNEVVIHTQSFPDGSGLTLEITKCEWSETIEGELVNFLSIYWYIKNNTASTITVPNTTYLVTFTYESNPYDKLYAATQSDISLSSGGYYNLLGIGGSSLETAYWNMLQNMVSDIVNGDINLNIYPMLNSEARRETYIMLATEDYDDLTVYVTLYAPYIDEPNYKCSFVNFNTSEPTKDGEPISWVPFEETRTVYLYDSDNVMKKDLIWASSSGNTVNLVEFSDESDLEIFDNWETNSMSLEVYDPGGAIISDTVLLTQILSTKWEAELHYIVQTPYNGSESYGNSHILQWQIIARDGEPAVLDNPFYTLEARATNPSIIHYGLTVCRDDITTDIHGILSIWTYEHDPNDPENTSYRQLIGFVNSIEQDGGTIIYYSYSNNESRTVNIPVPDSNVITTVQMWGDKRDDAHNGLIVNLSDDPNYWYPLDEPLELYMYGSGNSKGLLYTRYEIGYSSHIFTTSIYDDRLYATWQTNAIGYEYGSPTPPTPVPGNYTIADYLQQLIIDRNNLVNNLVSMGVSASQIETFTELVPKVLQIPSGGDYNSYVVPTEQDMENLSANERDICLVFQDTVIPMTSETATDITYLEFPTEVELSTTIDNPIMAQFQSQTDSYMNIHILPYGVNIDYAISGYRSFRVSYTSQDGQHYTMTTTDILNLKLSQENALSFRHLENWNDTLGYFLWTGTKYFGGPYQLINSNWEILNTGLTANNNYVFERTYLGANGVGTGTLGASIATTFDDNNAKLYGKLQAFYDNITPIVAPQNSSSLYGNSSIYTIPVKLDGTPLLDTSNTTQMTEMFYRCTNLITVPLLDLGNVLVTRSMFGGCISLIKVPQFYTPNLKDSREMFGGCSSLVEVPLFDTSNVTAMQSMFGGCTSLITVPIFDTSSTEYMGIMFSRSYNLSDTSLDNILVMCINAVNYHSSQTKSLLTLFGDFYIDEVREAYPVSRIQALPHYQAFINAGWTIGYN